jgi:hypothetical protein
MPTFELVAPPIDTLLYKKVLNNVEDDKRYSNLSNVNLFSKFDQVYTASVSNHVILTVLN